MTDTYKVKTSMLVHVQIEILCEADSKAGAIERAAELLPQSHDAASQRGWTAEIELHAPAGRLVRVLKATRFEQTSGNDKATKFKEGR